MWILFFQKDYVVAIRNAFHLNEYHSNTCELALFANLIFSTTTTPGLTYCLMMPGLFFMCLEFCNFKIRVLPLVWFNTSSSFLIFFPCFYDLKPKVIKLCDIKTNVIHFVTLASKRHKTWFKAHGF